MRNRNICDFFDFGFFIDFLSGCACSYHTQDNFLMQATDSIRNCEFVAYFIIGSDLLKEYVLNDCYKCIIQYVMINCTI